MGIILALLTSLFSTAQNTAVKKSAVKSDIFLVAWSIGTFSLVVIFPFFVALVFWQGMPEFTKEFWVSLIYKTPLMVIAYLCYVKAYKHGDLSLISPLLALTPAIILVIAPFVINQKASIGGALGVGLIVIGAYVLNFSASKEGFLKPIGKLFRDKGAKYMMLTASIWGGTSIIDTLGVRGVRGSSLQAGVSWAFFTSLVLVLVLTPFIIRKIRMIFKKTERKKFFMSGAFMGMAEICQMTAMTMLLAAYVNAIKRFSMVLGVIIGAIFFKEQDIQNRLTGSIIMLAGVILIILSV